MKSLNVHVEPELHRDLKIAATQRGQTIREFVREAIQDKINERKKLNQEILEGCAHETKIG